MTSFIAMDELTWPEVRELPRNIPLVLPLGAGYDYRLLASALGDPERAGLLPGLPFGFAGSGLEVPESILELIVANLLSSLRDDGFSRVYALAPQGVLRSLPGGGSIGPALISLPHTATFVPPVSLPPNGDQDKVVLISAGHTEQHAYHLPLSTDTLIIQAVAQGTAEAIPSLACALPTLPYGVSTHRSSFAGTLNCGGRAFEDFWLAVIDQLVARGFRRLYLLSGHGGSCSFFTNIVKYAGERHHHTFIATAWLYLSGPQGIEALQTRRKSQIGGMGHACELETSLILHLRPDLVHMDRVQDDIGFIATPSYYMDWVEGGALIANPPWEDDSKYGAYGAGSLGDAENGRFWLEAAVAEKMSHVEEIHEQYNRRAFARLKPRA